MIAFVAGLVADLFVLTPFGLSSLCFVLVAFTVGLAAGLSGGRAPYSFKLVTALIGGVAATLLYSLAAGLIGQPAVAHHELAAIALVVAAGCAVLVIPFGTAMAWALGGEDAAATARRISGGSATQMTGNRRRISSSPLKRLEDEEKELRRRSQPVRTGLRLSVMGIVVLGLFSVMIVRLWSLQVLQGPSYQRARARPHDKDVAIAPPRGLILSRNGDSPRRQQGHAGRDARPACGGERPGRDRAAGGRPRCLR